MMPRVHLVQCYDEAIISYRQSRGVLQTSASSFAVPGHIDGFTHILLLDGRLLGHWRHLRGRGDDRVEIRIERSLGGSERAALDGAIERYRRFSASG
jgi:Winged helix DNA-binding domain